MRHTRETPAGNKSILAETHGELSGRSGREGVIGEEPINVPRQVDGMGEVVDGNSGI